MDAPHPRTEIENASIAQVFSGEMHSPVLHFGAPPPLPSMEDLLDERQARRAMLLKARFWDAAAPIVALLFTVPLWRGLSDMDSRGLSQTEQLFFLGVMLMLPLGVWLGLPQELKAKYRAARHTIRNNVARLAELDHQIAYQEELERVRSKRGRH